MRDRNTVRQEWVRPVWATVQSARGVFGIWRNRWARARRWGRFAIALRDSLRQPISVEDARAIIGQRLVDREANFLQMVERNIFAHPQSPYLPLLKLAGCEMGDIRSMIRSTGLENTLRTLRQAGVYVLFEEFKGRQPIVRNGLVMHVQPDDFNNPHIHNYYEAQTGGTTGSASRVPIDLSRIVSQMPIQLLKLAAHDLVDVPAAIWRTVYGGYQLLEEEDDAGFTRLTLLVDPRIEIRDEKAVIDAVLGSLNRGTYPPVMWRQAKTLRIRRTQPVWTARGKLMPLHIAGRRSTTQDGDLRKS